MIAESPLRVSARCTVVHRGGIVLSVAICIKSKGLYTIRFCRIGVVCGPTHPEKCELVCAAHAQPLTKNRPLPLHPEEGKPLLRFSLVGVNQEARVPDEPRCLNGDAPLEGDAYVTFGLPLRAEADARTILSTHCLNGCPCWGHLRIVCRSVLLSSGGMALCHTIQYTPYPYKSLYL